MTAILVPDEEECYLLALLDDPSGVDLVEFLWVDDEQDDGCYRCWDSQWAWYRHEAPLQIDQCSRAVGKSQGIQMRAFAFPFNYPGREMLITAPELNHLRPITDSIEFRLMSTRLGREMLPQTKGKGIARQPHWQARFTNGARIISRLPNRDGRGVKGMHPLVLEGDEMQDYPLAGWIELIETLKRGSEGAKWRNHGVSNGVRDKYYELTQEGSGWTVHRLMAMHRPDWSKEERDEKVLTYGGSRANPDYRRNIYGDHGDATNPVFVLARLMATVDQEEGSEYNQLVYSKHKIEVERLRSDENPDGVDILQMADLPGTHIGGWTLAPKGYSSYYAGYDVGLTNHPSEILVFGVRAGTKREMVDLLARFQLLRIQSSDQMRLVEHLFDFYGAKLTLGIDRGGIGFPIFQQLHQNKKFGSRVYGWTFDENVVTDFEDRPLERNETQADLAVERRFYEYTTDVLRNEYVDARKISLPFDREVLTEWQGQHYAVIKSAGNPYGKRSYSTGSFHSLDAGRLAIAAKHLPTLLDMLDAKITKKPVFDEFPGAY